MARFQARSVTAGGARTVSAAALPTTQCGPDLFGAPQQSSVLRLRQPRSSRVTEPVSYALLIALDRRLPLLDLLAPFDFLTCPSSFLLCCSSSSAAWAAANRATGTLKGEQL